jgi:PTH1 family peptidyl-tRNA hydrolase
VLLLVGLGNPGPRYAGNRHNIGFMALDEIVRRHGFSAWRQRFHGEVAEGRLGDEKALALKPMTYMNESGRAVGEAVRFFKLAPAEVVVLHDELDLAPGKVRVKLGGGAAGHNGLRSIAQHIGADFKRVRLGIGHPGRKEAVHGWVLGDFAKADAEWLDKLGDALAKNAPLLAAGEDGPFMSRVNQEVGPPKPKAEKKPKTAKAEKGDAEAPAEAPADRKVPSAEAASDADGGDGSLASALKRAFGFGKSER